MIARYKPKQPVKRKTKKLPPKPRVKKEAPSPSMKTGADSVHDVNDELQPCSVILQKLMVSQDGGKSCVDASFCLSLPSSRRPWEARHSRLLENRETPDGFGHHSEAAEIGGNSVKERVRGARTPRVLQRDSLQQALRRSVESWRCVSRVDRSWQPR